MNQRCIKDIMKDFTDHTTAHGIGRLSKTRGIVNFVIWSLVCVAVFSLLILSLVLMTNEYLDSPKLTRIKLVDEAIPFPVVTVCNLKNYDLKLLHEAHVEMNRFNATSAGDYIKQINMLDELDWNNDNVLKKSMLATILRTTAQQLFLDRYLDVSKNATNDLKTHLKNMFYISGHRVFATTPKENVSDISTTKSKFIATCKFQYKECTYQDFDLLFSSDFFNCYSFNTSRLVSSPKTYITGSNGGLLLQLFAPSFSIFQSGILNQESRNRGTYENGQSGDGVRVMVHSDLEIPDLDHKGFDIPSGFSASSSLRITRLNRMMTEEEPCIEVNDETRNNIRYSQSLCRKRCLQEYTLTKCGCLDTGLPTDGFQNYPFCISQHNIPDICYEESVFSFEDGICKLALDSYLENLSCHSDIPTDIFELFNSGSCKCPSLCIEYVYANQISLSRWPAHQSMQNLNVLERFISSGFFDHFTVSERETYFSRLLNGTVEDVAEFLSEGHFIQLNVFLSDLTVMDIVEIPRYKFMGIVSDVGGQLGLWMGISIITITEFLGCMCSLLKWVLAKNCKFIFRDGRVQDVQ